VLVIGSRERTGQVVRWSDLDRLPGIRVVGYLNVGDKDDPDSLGAIQELGETIEGHSVDLVLVASTLAGPQLARVIRECFQYGACVSLPMADLPSIVGNRPGPHVMGWPLFEAPLPGFYLAQLLLKRAVDITVAVCGLLLLWPLLFGIAVLIYLDSPGPILFRQNRPGLGGRAFRMLKFRTMRVDAETVLKEDSEMYRNFLENDCKLPPELDPRITRVGKFLRRSSLDELPQLVNVLLGDMTLVGPRPVVGPELDRYGESATTILAVRPGITGYWQVHGRSTVAYPERADMDLHYVTNWSFAMDIRLLCLTIPAVIRRRGAF
jgi:exopolysaccharide production protein ExoY